MAQALATTTSRPHTSENNPTTTTSSSSPSAPSTSHNPSPDHNNSNNDDPDGNISPRSQLRSIPPWVITPDLPTTITNASHRFSQPLLLRPTTPLPPSTTNQFHLPADAAQRSKVPKGRRWDYLRTAEPALLDQTLHESSARWLPFMLSGPQYKPGDVLGAETMSDDWMGENIPAWAATAVEDEGGAGGAGEKRRSFLFGGSKGRMSRARRTVLKNPFVPLVFRLITVIFTLTALGLGARVYRHTKALDKSSADGCSQRASTYIALIVDSIAIPYILYVTWDEYTSKPLGLRSATAKMALLLVDLYFIVFYSSNLSLAFDALTDRRWACYQSVRYTCPYNPEICTSQAGLSGVLLVALLAWMITFSLSVLRVVKRLT